jgi:hypothetical protein
VPQLFSSSKHSTQKIFLKKSRPFFPTLSYCEFFIILFSHFYSDHTVLHVRSLHSISHKCASQLHLWMYCMEIYIQSLLCISFLLFRIYLFFRVLMFMCVIITAERYIHKRNRFFPFNSIRPCRFCYTQYIRLVIAREKNEYTREWEKKSELKLCMESQYTSIDVY